MKKYLMSKNVAIDVKKFVIKTKENTTVFSCVPK